MNFATFVIFSVLCIKSSLCQWPTSYQPGFSYASTNGGYSSLKVRSFGGSQPLSINLVGNNAGRIVARDGRVVANSVLSGPMKQEARSEIISNSIHISGYNNNPRGNDNSIVRNP